MYVDTLAEVWGSNPLCACNLHYYKQWFITVCMFKIRISLFEFYIKQFLSKEIIIFLINTIYYFVQINFLTSHLREESMMNDIEA